MSRHFVNFGINREYFAKKPGAIAVKAKRAPAIAFLFDNANASPSAAGFFGKAEKPAFHYHFKNEIARARHLQVWFEKMDAITKHNAEKRKARVSFRHTLKVGDILSNSWGYDQTNTEFYEITRLIGDTMAELRELACQVAQSGFLSEEVVPIPGQYAKAKVLRRRIQEGNTVNIYGAHFGWASLYHRREPGKIDLMPPKHVSHTH